MTSDERFQIEFKRAFFMGGWIFYLIRDDDLDWRFAPLEYWGA